MYEKSKISFDNLDESIVEEDGDNKRILILTAATEKFKLEIKFGNKEIKSDKWKAHTYEGMKFIDSGNNPINLGEKFISCLLLFEKEVEWNMWNRETAWGFFRNHLLGNSS